MNSLCHSSKTPLIPDFSRKNRKTWKVFFDFRSFSVGSKCRGESRPPTHQSLPEILGDDWFRNLQPNADWAKRHGLLILKENSLAGTCQKPILIIFENSRLIGPVDDLHSYLIYKITTKLTHHIQFSELRLKFLTYFL